MTMAMRVVTLTLAVAALLGAFARPNLAQEPATLLVQPLDRLDSIATRLEGDSTIKVEGDASLRSTTSWPTVVTLAQTDAAVPDAVQLEYTAFVRCAGLTGQAYLEMWVRLQDDGPYFSRGLDNACHGDQEWRRLSTPFRLESGQVPSEITLTLVVTGAGSVWVDDLRLTTQPLN